MVSPRRQLIFDIEIDSAALIVRSHAGGARQNRKWMYNDPLAAIV